nr:DUF2637 domain-containing protein [Wenjunlia tyrosinilytica]
MRLTGVHRVLVGVVVAGAVVIAGIGFLGSYDAVRDLAVRKGFGSFAYVFPVGVDAGIVVLLALDLLLAWLRIPFPLLRQAAWLLTAATIAFNGAASWPDALGVGMHAVIPLLFIVAVEAARHAVGRVADITADRHMESVRLARWLLAPVPTFRLWRRMRLWELRSYDQVIALERERLVYRARLRARYGRAWRRQAPTEALMPLRLARLGVPLTQTGPQGLAAAGIQITSATAEPLQPLEPLEPAAAAAPALQAAPGGQGPSSVAEPDPGAALLEDAAAGVREPRDLPPADHGRIAAPAVALRESAVRRAVISVPADPEQLAPAPPSASAGGPPPMDRQSSQAQLSTVDRYYRAWAQYLRTFGTEPTGGQLSDFLADRGFTGRSGGAVSPSTLRRYLPEFRIYTAWQYLKGRGSEPTAQEVTRLLAERGISGAPYTAPRIEPLLDDFPRRRAALAGDLADSTA